VAFFLERYVGQHEDGTSGEILATVSADGLHWREKARWNFQGNADSRAEIFYDDWIERYVLITRNWFFLPPPEAWREPCPHGIVAAPNCSQPPACAWRPLPAACCLAAALFCVSCVI
jgi:hypothetical protein